MNTRFDFRRSLNYRLKTNVYLSNQNQSSILRTIALKIFLKTRSRYDFSVKVFNKMKINQLLNQQCLFYYKYKEMLILEESEEFLQDNYDIETIVNLITDLLSYYSKTFFLLPNYLPLFNEYSILYNWMHQKQKFLNDINHILDNTNPYYNPNLNTVNSNNNSYNDDMSGSNAIGFLGNQSKEMRSWRKHRLSILNANLFITKTPVRVDESIESIEKFTHYIDLIEEESNYAHIKKPCLTMTPKKKEIANVFLYAKSNFLITMNKISPNNTNTNTNTITNTNSNTILKQNTRKKVNNKPYKLNNYYTSRAKMTLKKNNIPHKGHSDKFLKTETFFDQLRLKEKGLFELPINNTKEFIKVRKTHLKHYHSSKKSQPKSTLIQLTLNKEKGKEKEALPYLNNDKTMTITKKSPNITIDIKSSNKSNRIISNYRLKGFSDSSFSQIKCTTFSSPSIKRNSRLKGKSISMFSHDSDQLDYLIKTTFPKTKINSLHKKISNEKQTIYVNNIDRVKISN